MSTWRAIKIAIGEPEVATGAISGVALGDGDVDALFLLPTPVIKSGSDAVGGDTAFMP